MLPRAMDRNNSRPRRCSLPSWDRNSADWLAIDQRLAPDHPARLFDRVVAELDLTDLHKSYAGRGSLPHPPEMLLRLVLFEIWEGKLSPSQWHRDCAELDPVKWLLFGLQPSRSCLYAFRVRCAGVLDDFNRQILQRAQAEELVTVDDVSFDGTFVAARGSRHRLVTAKTLDKRLVQLDIVLASDFASATDNETAGAEAALTPLTEMVPPVGALCSVTAGASRAPTAGDSVAAEAIAEPTPHVSSTPEAPAPIPTAPCTDKSAYWMATTPATRLKQRLKYRSARETLKHKHQSYEQTLSRRAKKKRRSAERIVICPTEPEAALGRDKLKTFRPLYNVQLARAVGASFVVGYDVVAAVTDAGQFGPLACRVESLCGRRPKRVPVDEQYAGHVDLSLARELGIVIYAPTRDMRQADGARKKPDKGMIPKQEFVWLPEEQTYRCPKGHLLKFVRAGTQKRQGGETVKHLQYRCPGEHCKVCPVQAKCTRTPERGRIVKRSEYDDLAEELRDRMRLPESQEFYRERKQTVELGFADLKEHRGLRQFHGFGLIQVQTQVAMLVLAVNGMALMKSRRKKAARSASCDEEAAQAT